MPRYFFDIHDGRNDRDEEGCECADIQAAVLHTKRALPEIAAAEILKAGESQTITMVVSDEDGHAVYLAAVTYTGTRLSR